MSGGKLDPFTYLDALERSLEAEGPQICDLISRAKNFYHQRLWHELTVAVTEAFKHPKILSVAIDFHEFVLVPSRPDMSPFAYCKLLYMTVFSLSDSSRGLELMDSAMASMVGLGSLQGQHCVNCIKALLLMSSQATADARRLLSNVQTFIGTLQLHEVEPILLALQFRGRIREYDLQRNFSKYYSSAFDFVRYCELAEMPLMQSEVRELSYKTTVAALLSLDTYNFGRLLQFKPFTNELRSDADFAWLLHGANLMNDGDVNGFTAFVHAHANQIAQIPDLQSQLVFLHRKARIMALLYLIFYTPVSERRFTFQAVAQQCSMALEDVEPLLLTALALGVIDGKIDGLLGVIDVWKVVPRVLSHDEVRELAKQVSAWRDRVRDATKYVTELSKDLPQ